MLSVNQAQTLILDLVQPLKDTEIISLDVAAGRILAQPIISQLDFPYWDNSAMDGYAVKFKDVQGCTQTQPAILDIVAEIPAGQNPSISIQSGQTARIFTGAMLPAGADTIIMQENTQREGNRVKILSSPDQPKAYVRQRGDYYQAGNPLLKPGIAINAPEIAVLATAQCTQLTVYRRPKVVIFSTGDELIPPNQPLQPGQIIDSNQYALAAFVGSQGAISIPLGIVKDNKEALKKTIAQAIATGDIVLSTGGVSVGEYDYIEEILTELGGNIQIRSVAVTPGKPLTVATFSNGCLYFGIPGNPVSALVSCWRFVQPALKKLSGLEGNWHPIFIKARSRHDLPSKGARETYLWGQLLLVNGVYEFELAGGKHSSANLINLAQTNGLAVMPVGQTFLAAGEDVTVMQIDSLK
ncbi:molybdenum cofactor synthesis domain protein [Gloeothece citriformis PCC 7424]|uniref:Molybdopterin molybdenumtransferase n=1 Tax=Gloeothece citriformis (strain PCC 7424) TaxID=65393 RepID=B7KHG0_GLOC7|nr:gephyrin-like molybdotransferase Glp [Gloeothece citriformis]ACK70655.1 molybdenum cofactor synthesis domain protein [Gloeothece citriformis PCC 7424]